MNPDRRKKPSKGPPEQESGSSSAASSSSSLEEPELDLLLPLEPQLQLLAEYRAAVRAHAEQHAAQEVEVYEPVLPYGNEGILADIPEVNEDEESSGQGTGEHDVETPDYSEEGETIYDSNDVDQETDGQESSQMEYEEDEEETINDSNDEEHYQNNMDEEVEAGYADDEYTEQDESDETEEERAEKKVADAHRLPVIDYAALLAQVPKSALPEWPPKREKAREQRCRDQEMHHQEGLRPNVDVAGQVSDEDDQDPFDLAQQFNRLFLLPPPPPVLPPEEVDRFYLNFPLPHVPNWILEEAAAELAEIARQDDWGSQQPPVHAAIDVLQQAAERAGLHYRNVAEVGRAREMGYYDNLQPYFRREEDLNVPHCSRHPQQLIVEHMMLPREAPLQSATSLGAGDAPLNEDEFFANLPLPPLPEGARPAPLEQAPHLMLERDEHDEKSHRDEEEQFDILDLSEDEDDGSEMEDDIEENIDESERELTAQEMMLMAIRKAARFVTEQCGQSVAHKITRNVLSKVTEYDPQVSSSTPLMPSPRESLEIIIKRASPRTNLTEPDSFDTEILPEWLFSQTSQADIVQYPMEITQPVQASTSSAELEWLVEPVSQHKIVQHPMEITQPVDILASFSRGPEKRDGVSTDTLIQPCQSDTSSTETEWLVQPIYQRRIGQYPKKMKQLIQTLPFSSLNPGNSDGQPTNTLIQPGPSGTSSAESGWSVETTSSHESGQQSTEVTQPMAISHSSGTASAEVGTSGRQRRAGDDSSAATGPLPKRQYSEEELGQMSVEEVSKLISAASSDEVEEIFAKLPLPPLPTKEPQQASAALAESDSRDNLSEVVSDTNDEMYQVFSGQPLLQASTSAQAAEEFAASEYADEYEETAAVAETVVDNVVREAADYVRRTMAERLQSLQVQEDREEDDPREPHEEDE